MTKPTRRSALRFLLALAPLAGCAVPGSGPDPSPDPTVPDLLSRASTAIGGAPGAEARRANADAADSPQLLVQTVASTSQRFDPGQTFRVGDAPKFIQDLRYTRVRDLRGGRVRTAWDRAAGYPGQVPFTYDEIVAPRAGFFTAPHNFQELLSGIAQNAMPSATVDATLRNRELDEPHLLLAEAVAHPERVTLLPPAVIAGRRAFVLALARPFAPIRLAIDAVTFLPLQAARVEDDAVFGDAELSVGFDQWSATRGVRVPGLLTRAINGHVVQTDQRTGYAFTTTRDVGQFDVPASLAVPYDPAAAVIGDEHPELFDRGTSFGFLQGEPVTAVTLDLLAPGIYHITGATHHSLAIGTDHGVVVVEAPNDDARSLAVQHAIEVAFPGKPIQYVINTHHHHDHIGGLRTYVAHGVPVVAPATDLGFLREVFATPHTVRPDTLALHPQPAQLIGVDASGWSFTDGRTIQAILLTSDHAEQQLVVYVPDAKLVFESDLYFPTFFPIDQPTPGPLGASTRQLYQDLVLDRGLDIQVVAGGHAGVANAETFRVNAGF